MRELADRRPSSDSLAGWRVMRLTGTLVLVSLLLGHVRRVGGSAPSIADDPPPQLEVHLALPLGLRDGRPATAPPPLLPPGTGFDGERAMAHAQAQCDLGPRPPGSEAHGQTGEYIARELERVGWSVEVDEYLYRRTELRNLIGRQGAGPVVMVAAHYDTRRVADNDPDADRRDKPVVGANDGASGVAVLLELARVLEVAYTGHAVWLAFFDAEDQGGVAGWDWFVGSTRMAEEVSWHEDLDFAGLVLLDMIGDLDQRVCRAHDSTPGLADALFAFAGDLGYGEWLPEDCVYYVADDHTPFLRLGLPAMDMIDFDYEYWHTQGDTCDKIGPTPLSRVGRTIETWLESGAPQLEELAGD